MPKRDVLKILFDVFFIDLLKVNRSGKIVVFKLFAPS